MNTISETALSEFGLTPDLLINGEQIEFDPAQKVNGRKNQYVLYEFAKKLVEACTRDLAEAYRTVEELEAKNAELETQASEAADAANISSDQIRKVLAKDQDFQAAERMLAKVEQQLDTFAKDKQADQKTITELRTQVGILKEQVKDLNQMEEELNTLRQTVPQLEADVNQVLEDLRANMEAEGIPIDDLGETDI